jgi:adenine-specific DNA-methyltransferase
MNVVAQKSVDVALGAWRNQEPTVVFSGDCMDILRPLPDGSISLTITSPPYCMGKEYETSNSINDFIAAHKLILPQVVRVTRDGGSICWQVGYHVEDGCCEPLDYLVFDILRTLPGLNLRNRIMWTFGHGLHSQRRFSGRHETVLWFTKGDNYYFDLDAVRVPQKYPGKRHYKGAHRGEFSGNPKGKNPSDVWEIPNVKANHIEKTGHPCQFPVGLAERLVRGLCPKDGLVFDPYMGSASTGVAAVINGRRFLGAETEEKYVALACDRLSMAYAGTLQHRPVNQPIHVPSEHETVARRPAHFVETLS